ncbi:MAG: hypothetical protein K1Y36_08955 [Blastocatellia bacterium]|nr:hypothetical protein [Blastocatellia bacterium]
MIERKRLGWIAVWLTGVGMGLALQPFAVIPESSAARQNATAPAAANRQEAVLAANLYMQTSAEYRAVCLQTYAWASERLRAKLAVLNHNERKPAVVMDLDETVFDNSSYQSFLDQTNQDYNPEAWNRFERDYPQEVRLVPGARQFIEFAEANGVTVIFISNRAQKNQAGAIAALKHNRINTDNIEERLLLKDTTSDKTERRKLAESKFRVMMLVGDNLRDFSEEFVAPKFSREDSVEKRLVAIEERAAKTNKAAHRWGNDWIVLPNPVYGEWLSLLGPNPRAGLKPSGIK